MIRLAMPFASLTTFFMLAPPSIPATFSDLAWKHIFSDDAEL